MACRILRTIAKERHQSLRILHHYSSAASTTLHSPPKSKFSPVSAFDSSADNRICQANPWNRFVPANTRCLSASPASSKVLILNSDAEFSNALNKAQDNKGLAVAYFTAAWCGPCRTIAPLVENLSKSYSNVTFLKLDIDQENLSNTLKNSGVMSVPTFHFYKNGVKVADLVGADPERLKETVGNLSN